MSACPNKKSKEWLQLVKDVGIFEAYRTFIKNDYDVPTFHFKTKDDVTRYLDYLPQVTKSKGEYYIPYGKDYGTWTTNRSLMRAERERINNIYGPLLIIESTKVTKPNPRTAGRTYIDKIKVNEQALIDYYNLYKDPIELQKEVEDRGQIYVPNYEQRITKPNYIGKELDRKVKGFWDNKEYLSSDRNAEGEGSNVIMYTSTFEGETIQFLDDKDDLRYTLSPTQKLDAEEGSLFDELNFEQRTRLSKLSPENRKDFEEKKAVMLKTFPRVTEVIEDFNITQAGTLESNGTVIKVNPNLWTTDTIGHEFGHLLIDIIGGTSNPLIKKARKQLIGSDIEASVKERYTDLVEAEDDRIDKEIVAQAIGEQTAKIFDIESKRAEWKNILIRILDRVKKILHISHNASKELARRVLSGESINSDSTLNVETAEQRSSVSEVLSSLKKQKKSKSEIQVLRDKVEKALEHKHARYKKQDVKNRLKTLEDTITKIKELDDSPVEGLKLFQDFAIKQTQQVYDLYTQGLRSYNKLQRSMPGGKGFSLHDLSKWKDYVSGFSLLSELSDLAEDLEVDILKANPELESILNKDMLAEAIRQRNVIEKAYVEHGVGLVADFLTPYSKHIEAAVKEAAEKDYKDLTVEDKKLITKDLYIEKQLEDKEDDIKKRTKEMLSVELLKASKDVGVVTRWLDNIMDSPDAVVSAMGQAFVESDFKSRNEFYTVQDEMLTAVKGLEAYYNNSGLLRDTKDIYEFMLEKDSKGVYTQHYVSPYSSKLWDDYDSYKKELEKIEDITFDEREIRLKKWKKDNVPVNNYALRTARDSFYDELISKGLMTKAQKNELNHNDHWQVEVKKQPEEIVSDIAAEYIHDWFKENLWKYRTPINHYRNPQWLKLVKMAGGDVNQQIHIQIEAVKENVAKDPRITFYNLIVAKNEEIQKGIPYGHRLHTRLPSVLKSTGERLQAGQGPLAALKHTINNSLNVLADESERGERILTDEAGDPVHFIPVYYTTDMKKYYEREFDNMTQAQQDKLKQTKEEYVNTKKEAAQSYDLGSIYAKYYNSAISFKHKHEILPQMEMARFLVSQRKVDERDGKGNFITDYFDRKKEGRAKYLSEQLGDWFESMMYGIKEKDEGVVKVLGATVDIGKAANTLNKYTALNLLGFNFITGTANVILGSTMQFLEASGGRYYDTKDWAKAKAIYGKNLPGILGDVGSRKPNNKVSLLLRKFDILNEYNMTEFRKNSKFSQLLESNSIFFMSHAGEHLMQSQVLLAMLNRKIAKDKNGNELGSMLDQFSVEKGQLVLNKEVSNFSTKDQAAFEAKIRRLLASLHGEYSDAGRVAVQRYAVGRMAYMFRKFVIPGIRRRYQRKQVNNGLGDYVEGNYRTTGRYFHMLFKDLKNKQFALMSTEWGSLQDWEKTNIRKALMEFSFMLSATILSGILVNMKEDDDDDAWLTSFLAYQALRYKTELWFFSNPSEAMKIMRSPAASMSVIENTIKLFGQMLPPNFEGFERYERGSWKGRPKINKTLVNFVPGLKQVYRTKYVADQINWLNN